MGTPLPYLAALLALYLLAPLAALVPELGPATWRALGGSGVLAALGVSLASATLSTALIALLGIPLAYLLARSRGTASRLIGILVQLPLAVPPLVAGVLLLLLVGPYSALGHLSGGALTDSFAGIVLAQTFVASPFLIVAARSAFAALPASLEGVAATLGHGPWTRFWRVSLTVSWPAILSGLCLSWLRAFGEFGATVMVAYHPFSLPVYTYTMFGTAGLASTLAPIVASLLAAIGVLILVWRLPLRAARRGAPPLPAPARPVLRAPGRPVTFSVRASHGDFHLDVAYRGPASHLVILGPSGSGKSLTLRHVAGLEPGGQSQVHLGGRDLGVLSPERRGVGYVPQDFGLFPHLDVARQVTFGVGARADYARYWLERLGLEGLEGRLPDGLSGGQRQRVALARALAPMPALLLLDEPFSALDAPVRASSRRQIRQVTRELGVSTIVVTHDVAEAALFADDLLVLRDGRVSQSGPVGEVLAHPASPFVAGLVGFENVFVGTPQADGTLLVGGIPLPTFSGGAPTERVAWAVRAEAVRVGTGPWEGRVEDATPLGERIEARVRLEERVVLTIRTDKPLRVGEGLHLTLPEVHLRVWRNPEETGEPSG